MTPNAPRSANTHHHASSLALRPRLSRALAVSLALTAGLSACADLEHEPTPSSGVVRVDPRATPTGSEALSAKADLPFASPLVPVMEQASAQTTQGDEQGLFDLLWSIYDRYTEHADAYLPHGFESEHGSGEPPQEDCLNCGRETGFLPPPEVTLESVTPLEHKDTSYVTFAWGAVEGGNRYRVVLLQVDEALGEVSDVSTTDVQSPEVGLGLTHGFSYIVYMITYHNVSKAHSEPSAPLFLRCSLSYGCGALNP